MESTITPLESLRPSSFGHSFPRRSVSLKRVLLHEMTEVVDGCLVGYWLFPEIDASKGPHGQAVTKCFLRAPVAEVELCVQKMYSKYLFKFLRRTFSLRLGQSSFVGRWSVPLIFMSLLLLCYDTGSIATPIQKRLIQKLFKNIPEEAFCGLWILKIIKNSEKHPLIVPIIYSTRNSLVQIFALSHP